MKKILILLVLIIVVGCGCGYLFYNSGIGAVSADDNEEIVVEIEQGSGAYAVIESLNQAGLIKNSTCAKMFVKLNSPESLQANTYLLNKTMTLPEIIEIIQNGEFKYILKTRFTIIEGSTYKDAAANIAESLGLKEKEVIAKWNNKKFLKELINDYWFLTDEILDKDIICPLEGYLYPETYFVTDKEPNIESITRQILDLTDEELTKYKEQIQDSGMSVHEFLTLASVVQNESLFEEDLTKIAGVFVNRLNQDMPLQSDITVLYALGEKRVDVTYEDLEVDSKYNTYKYAGLPPGPVSNPASVVVDACINYEKHDYFFFFATEEGKVLYSKTLAQHEKTVEENMWY